MPSPANAAVSIEGDPATFAISIVESEPGKDRVSLETDQTLGFVITDLDGIPSVGFPCESLSPTVASCPVGDTTELFFNLAEKNDRVFIFLPEDPTVDAIRYVYRLGAGNDRFTGGVVGENVRSGIGDDRLKGNEGDDFLSAGKGDDELDGGSGDDTCNGGPNRDGAKACEQVKGIP